MTIDYSKGKIYKLTSGDLVYYGSTCSSLYKRFSIHKSQYKRSKEGKCSPSTTSLLFENGDVSMCLVEEFPCLSKGELMEREAFFITNNKCVNKITPKKIPTCSYYQENKDKLNKRRLLNYLQKSYPFITDDNIELWKQHGKVIRKIIKQLNKIQDDNTKEQILELIKET